MNSQSFVYSGNALPGAGAERLLVLFGRAVDRSCALFATGLRLHVAMLEQIGCQAL